MNELYDPRHEKRTFLKMMLPTSNHSLLGAPCAPFGGHWWRSGSKPGGSDIEFDWSTARLTTPGETGETQKDRCSYFFSGIFLRLFVVLDWFSV